MAHLPMLESINKLHVDELREHLTAFVANATPVLNASMTMSRRDKALRDHHVTLHEAMLETMRALLALAKKHAGQRPVCIDFRGRWRLLHSAARVVCEVFPSIDFFDKCADD